MSLQFVVTGSFVVGDTTTNPVTLNECNLVGITTGSNLTGTAMTFLVSTNNGTYTPLYDSTSTEVSLTITTAARSYSLSPSVFFPWNFVKARLGTSASAVAQTTVNSFIDFNMKKIP
jgi:hypothetical protein